MGLSTFAHWTFPAKLWLELGPIGSGDWNEIAGVERITPPQEEVDEDEVTNHGSPNGVEEIIATIIRTGEFDMSLIYDSFDDDANRFHRDFKKRRNRRYRVELAEGQGTLLATAFVKRTPFEELTPERALRQRTALRACTEIQFLPGNSA